MKYFILLAMLCCVACNQVKKITNKTAERSHFKEVKKKDSLVVREDLTRLQEKYFKNNNRSLLISFFPKTMAATNDSLRIVDTNGAMIIYPGENIPANIVYQNIELQTGQKDSLSNSKDSTVDRSKQKVDHQQEKKEVQKDKESDRVPWYLIVIVGILLGLAALLFRKMTSIPGVQVSDTRKA